jgi:Zn ribbon nucleic-acid-binding protein
MEKLISNCPLCEEHSLHLIGEGEAQLMQCIWCGYVSSSKFKGTKEENDEYKKLTDEMKEWAKEAIGRIWIPSLFTLPDGMIYPQNDKDGVMKWKLAELVVVPEDERKNYPVEGQVDKFYDKRYQTEKPKTYDNFYEVMSVVNEKAKNQVKMENEPVKIKLPKIKKT